MVTLDGVDIAKIGLHALRANVAVISQDPVLFSGEGGREKYILYILP